MRTHCSTISFKKVSIPNFQWLAKVEKHCWSARYICGSPQYWSISCNFRLYVLCLQCYTCNLSLVQSCRKLKMMIQVFSAGFHLSSINWVLSFVTFLFNWNCSFSSIYWYITSVITDALFSIPKDRGQDFFLSLVHQLLSVLPCPCLIFLKLSQSWHFWAFLITRLTKTYLLLQLLECKSATKIKEGQG